MDGRSIRGEILMIKAQCHICHELFEVPDNKALTYIMMNLIPCRECAQRSLAYE